MAERRQLRFDSLDDAVRDAEGLLAKGYEKAGNWDLAQVCGHVSEWMRFGLDGFPRAPAPIRMFMWVARNSFGPGLFRKYIAEGSPGFKTGGPTMPQTVPAAGGDERAAVDTLRAVVDRAKAFDRDPIPSPFFGPMTRDEWVRLQKMHCAHHLSFLVPKS
jgi:Protein of unknown function (DUF1569)